METELYKAIMQKFYSEKCSKCEFAKKYELSHFWFADFTNPKSKRRVLRPRTVSILVTNLGIAPELCQDYNEYVLKND